MLREIAKKKKKPMSYISDSTSIMNKYDMFGRLARRNSLLSKNNMAA